MLSVRACALRRGVTLVELVVAIVVGGVVLSLVASISVRQQRIYSELSDATALGNQLRDAAAILPIGLRGAAPAAGDIRNGEARDTAVEIRSTIASGIACDTSASRIVLAPSIAGGGTFASALTPIEAGDTAWIYSSRDALDAWRAFRVTSVATVGAGACAPLGPTLRGAEQSAQRVAIALDAAPPPADIVGSPVRFTRPLRYSVYRAADGAWYVGEREWNNAGARFNTIQPVAGPFLSAALGGVVFEYVDTVGVLLATPVADGRAISLIRLTLRGQTRSVIRELSAAAPIGNRYDSLSLDVLLRNRR